MNKSFKKISVIIIRALIIVSISFFLIKKLVESWNQISGYSFKINYWLMILSIIVLCLSFLSAAFGWLFILKKLKQNLNTKKGLLIFFKAQISRYVPGTIWPYVSRIYSTRKENIPKTPILISFLLESSFAAIVPAILSFLVLFPYLRLEMLSNYLTYFVIAILLIPLTHPKILGFFINIIMKILKREKITIKIKYYDLWIIFCIYTLRAILLGTAFVIFSNAIYPMKFTNWPLLFGASILSWLVGFLFVIVPGGIGVKEAVIALLLKPIMPLGMAIIIALSSRLWLITGELVTFFTSYVISKYKK